MSVVATSPEQRDRALKTANVSRLGRAGLKREVRDQGVRGAETVAGLVLDSAPMVDRMLIWQLVQWVPWLGEARAARMLRLCGIDSWTQAGRLTARQRKVLAVQLRRHAQGLRPVPPKPPGPGPRHRGNPVCSVCREHLLEPSEDGLCGFCRDEAAA